MKQKLLKKMKWWITVIPLVCLLSFSSYGQGQELVVSGKVTSIINQEPLPGVSVLIKNTSNGTITDVNGNYTIEVPSSESVLVFSFVGFLSEEVPVGNQSEINIALAEDITALDEVVVVGYGTQKKEAITAAISNINSKDIQHVPGANTSTLLAGKLPGLSFRQADGRPGATAAIKIRNMGTPLFVIDGIQKDQGQFNQLSANDIESITILKDASAAIYGSRAANGVVLVTTKRGQLGEKPQVNLNGYYGIQNWTRFPKTVNAYEYQLATAEARVNDRLEPNITQEELDLWKEGTAQGYRSFDWYDFIIEGNAPQSKVNLNVSGGSEKTNYYFSVSHFDQSAVFGSDFEFKRTNLQANIDTRINERLKVGLDINGRVETTKNPGLPNPDDYWMPRFALFRNRPTERPYANDNPKYPAAISNIETNWALLNYETSGSFQRDWRVAQANLHAEYEILDGLIVKGLGSYWFADRLEDNFEYTYDVYRYDEPSDTYIDVGGNDNPYRSRGTTQLLEYVLQGQLDYNKVFGDHTVGATFAVERIERNSKDHFQHGVPNTNFIDLMYFDELDAQGYADNTSVQARIGYIGRLSYAFKRKYYLEASGRRDASWKFSPDDRWGNYFSVSAGWRISEEPFFESLGIENILNDLKIRASYGELGDDQILINGDPIDPFAYISGYNYPQGTFINNGEAVITARDRGVPITNLTWYTSNISDIGIDFELFSGKLTGSIDGFIRKRTGLNAPNTTITVPVEIGYELPQENLESDIQQGGEIALFYNTNIGEVEIGLGGNYAYSRRKWDTPAPEIFGNSWDEYRWSRKDRYDGIYWGYEVVGQFTSQDQINNHPINNDGQGNATQLPGDLIFKDVNGDKVIDGLDERPIGYFTESGNGGITPLINYGFNISIGYKGFDLIADFSGGAGYTFARNWELKNPFQATGNLLASMYDSRWHREDPFDPNSPWIAGDAPALRPNGNHVNYTRNSSYWLRNVRYLRARTIELGYSFPETLLENIKIQHVRVFISSYNLFSIDNVKEFGIDPEAAEHNGLQYPQNRIFNLGFDITF